MAIHENFFSHNGDSETDEKMKNFYENDKDKDSQNHSVIVYKPENNYVQQTTKIITTNTIQNPEVNKEESIEEKRKNITVRGLSGLKNLGNTCYMNSVLQCLAHLDLFGAWLINKKYKKRLERNKLIEVADEKRKRLNLSNDVEIDINKSDLKSSYKKSITHQIAKLFKTMWKHNCTISPKSLKSSISDFWTIFSGYTQNDSQELLNLLLDKIHEETKCDVKLEFNNVPSGVIDLIDIRNKCSNIIKNQNTSLEQKQEANIFYLQYRKNYSNEVTILKAYTYWKQYINKNHSIITDLFTGLFYSKIICDECGSISSSFEPFNIISISTQDFGETTLETCLKEFSKEEILTGENKYSCKQCKKNVNAKKKIYIWEQPEILIIQLKRFKNDKNRTWKTNSTVKFPLNNLELKDNLCDINKTQSQKYELSAISEHFGSCNFGHYKAHCKNGINNKWYEFDDDDIIHVPDTDIANEIVTKNAYILIYIKKN
ncbi:Ubiquitin carboxyl-terminal hydrolase [uncultured virus]|nr:Ubiquitin carboxyl-terminal hydrolase [uncultured virus]